MLNSQILDFLQSHLLGRNGFKKVFDTVDIPWKTNLLLQSSCLKSRKETVSNNYRVNKEITWVVP